MLRIEMERAGRYCDGLSRRSFVQAGFAAATSLSLPGVLRAREAASAAAKDTSVIFIWLDGGSSQLDTFDMKPDAPLEIRSMFNPINTNVPGIQITELMPKLAKQADKFCLLRSLHHDNGDHFAAGHVMLTSYFGANGSSTAGRSPGIGAITAKVCGARQPGMPPYVAVPNASTIGLRPGYFGGNYLGAEFNPFETGGDPNSDKFAVDNVQLTPGLSVDRLDNRRELLSRFDNMRRDMDSSGLSQSMDRFDQAAFNMVAGPRAREAFDISKEDAATREAYGRNTWGQSTLLCRRLTEAGCTFVTACFGGWDHHSGLKKGYENIIPKVDAAVAALLGDLAQRGRLDKTMVVVASEFGRAPRLTESGGQSDVGRDHWGNSMTVLLAGGGVKGGNVVGSTNRIAERPADRPCTPSDLHASIYRVLGVDPTTHFNNLSGRPTPIIENGKAIEELF